MSFRFMIRCLGFVALLAATPCPASPPAAADDAQAVIDLIAAAGDAADHPEANSVVVFDRTDVTMEDSGLSHVTNHVLTKILTPDGAIDQSCQYFEYDPATQLIELRRVAVYRRDGVVDEIDASQLVDVTAPAHAIYWGMHMVAVEVPNLGVGDAVEVETYRKGFQIAYLGQDEAAQDESKYIPPMAGHFYDVVLFQGGSPIVEKTYTLRTPLDKPVQYSSYNGDVSASQTYDDENFTYVFAKRDVPAAPHEWRRAALTDIAPKVVLATVQDWQEKSRWFFATNDWVFADNADIKAKVRELVDGLDSDDERVAAINHWVAQNIRYCGLNMGEGEGYTIHPGEMIFRERSGVCKDIAGMTITMLRSAGYEVYPAMTMAGARVEAIPADQFNHCVAAMRLDDGSFRMLDPTWIPFSRYDWSRAEGEQHYVIGTPEGETLTTTPVYGPDHNRAEFVIRGGIDENGDLTGRISIKGDGYIDTRIRRAKGSAAISAVVPALERWLSSLSAGAELVSCEFGDPADFSRTCGLELEFRAPGYAMVGRRTATWLPVAPSLILANYAGTSRFPDRDLPEERETPAMLWFSSSWDVDELISPPRGYSAESPDGSWTAGEAGDAAWCDLDCKAGRGGIRLDGELAVRDRIVQPADWPEFRAAVETLRELGGTRLVARRKGQ